MSRVSVREQNRVGCLTNRLINLNKELDSTVKRLYEYRVGVIDKAEDRGDVLESLKVRILSAEDDIKIILSEIKKVEEEIKDCK